MSRNVKKQYNMFLDLHLKRNLIPLSIGDMVWRQIVEKRTMGE